MTKVLGYAAYIFLAMGLLMSGFMALGGKSDAGNAAMITLLMYVMYGGFSAFIWVIVGHRKHKLHIRTAMLTIFIALTTILVPRCFKWVA